jgi:aryl-alcohol dehydrogenase-like predicted oxidoreductase
VVSDQINYNALNRSPEKQLLNYCRTEKVAVVTHSSLAKGLLCGRYGTDHTFASDDERSGFTGYSGKLFARYLAAVEELKVVAQEHNLSIVQAAIIWLLARVEVTSVLIGPKSISQLEESVEIGEKIARTETAALRERMNRILDAHDLPALCPFPDQLV